MTTTPGPWTIAFCEPRAHVAEIHVRPHLRIIIDHREDFSDPTADARLIVEAPAMRDELEVIACDMDYIYKDHGAAQRVRALLARIEGKE